MTFGSVRLRKRCVFADIPECWWTKIEDGRLVKRGVPHGDNLTNFFTWITYLTVFFFSFTHLFSACVFCFTCYFTPASLAKISFPILSCVHCYLRTGTTMCPKCCTFFSGFVCVHKKRSLLWCQCVRTKNLTVCNLPLNLSRPGAHCAPYQHHKISSKWLGSWVTASWLFRLSGKFLFRTQFHQSALKHVAITTIQLLA